MATVALAHDLTGDGPLLVLLHGITEDRRAWDPLLPELAREHRVLRVDLRGHGDSPAGDGYELPDYASDVAALVAELDEDGAPLVIGHSLGGAVATAYAAAVPVRGVINVDQSLDLAGFQEQVRAAEPVLRGEGFRDAMFALFDGMRGELADDEWARLTAIRDPRQDVVLGTWALLLEQPRAEVEQAVSELATAVKQPYLTVFGNDAGREYASWLAARMPQSRIETWDGLGHYPHLARPDRFLAVVAAFEHKLTPEPRKSGSVSRSIDG